MKKYRLKQQGDVKAFTEAHDLVCLRCGNREPTTITVFRLPDGTEVRPSTTIIIWKGLGIDLSNTWLGCLIGAHKSYFDYEVEPVPSSESKV